MIRLGIGTPSCRIAFAIEPSDTGRLTTNTRAIYVGGAGDLACVMDADGAVVTFTGVTAGSVLPVCCTRVDSSGTTATDIVGLC